MFDGVGEPEIFSAPEPRGKLGTFLSPKAYVEEAVRRVTPRTSLRSVLHQQAVIEGGQATIVF